MSKKGSILLNCVVRQQNTDNAHPTHLPICPTKINVLITKFAGIQYPPKKQLFFCLGLKNTDLSPTKTLLHFINILFISSRFH